METPYKPPTEALKTAARHGDPGAASGWAIAGFIVLPLLGGLLGFAGYIAAALLLESWNQPSGPTLSYGQQAFLISLPICTVIGAAIGFSVAFSLLRLHLVSVALLAVVWFAGSKLVNSIWENQIAEYGRDPSEVVLYYPPMALSILALLIAVAMGLVSVIRWRKGVM